MIIKKILGSLVIVLLLVCASLGQQLKMKRSGNMARVSQNGKVLYQIALRGKKNEKGRKYDEAFLAGACLIVRRDVREWRTGTESYPEVSRLEIYQANGKRRVYRESDLAISRVLNWDLINSPDFSWAIIPDNGEAMFSGYFYVSPQCEMRETSFNTSDNFDWGSREDASFVDAATLKFSPIVYRLPGSETKEINIFITKDGKFRVEDIEK